MLLLGRIHTPTERIRHLPQLGFITDIRTIACLRLIFGFRSRHIRFSVKPLQKNWRIVRESPLS